MDVEKSSNTEDSSSYELRTRKIRKRPEISAPIPVPKPLKPDWTEDMEVENSQESVSMLQDCYQKNDFPETCMDSELEVIDIYSEDESDVEETQNRSTQTDFSHSQMEQSEEKEKQMAKHAQFISSIVKLKTALSSKEIISDKKLQEGEEPPCGMEIDGQIVPKEAIGYVLRSSDLGNVFRETVQILLQHLEDTLGNDFLKIASCWRNSIYETVVQLLREAVDSDAWVAKRVACFLIRIVDSILEDDKSKNLTLESKTNFVKEFCRSTHLCFAVADSIIKNLRSLNEIKRRSDSPSRKKLYWVYLTKNSSFLLRILESSLEFLKSKLEGERAEDVFRRKPEMKNYNVLEMWKKHWNEVPEEGKREHEWEATISEWCEVLDEVLLHCVDHVPVLSMAVERCGESAKEILKMCHPVLIEDRKRGGCS